MKKKILSSISLSIAVALFSAGIAFAASSSAFVDAALLCKYLRNDEANGHQLDVGFVPYSTEVVEGAPVIVTFVLRNAGKTSITIPRFSSRGRDFSYGFEVTDSAGNKIGPSENFGFGGLGWSSNLDPADSLSDSLFLSEYIQPLKAGKYTVVCHKSGDERSSESLHAVRTEFSLTVLTKNEAKLGKTIEEIGRVIESNSDTWDTAHFQLVKTNLETATEALGLFNDKRVVPYLLKSLNKGEFNNINPALIALAKYPSRELIPPIAEKLHCKTDSSIRASAARALASFKFGQAVKALRAALKDEDQYVRKDAVSSLGEIGDKSTIKDIIPLLSDSSKAMQIAAINALAKLGQKPKFSWFDAIFSDTKESNESSNAIWMIDRMFGASGITYLASKLNLNDPGKKNYRNYMLINHIHGLSGQMFIYLFDFNDNGTPEEQARNLKTMKEVLNTFGRYEIQAGK